MGSIDNEQMSPDRSSTYHSKIMIQKVLAASGFNGIEADLSQVSSLEGHGSRLLISTAIETSEPKIPQHCGVVILTSPASRAQAAFASRLAIDIEGKQGHPTTVVEWSGETSFEAVRGKLCISLLEYEDELLSGLSSEDFMLLKSLLATSDSILWISKAVHRCRPHLHIMDGLSRVLRAENVNLKLVRLAMEGGAMDTMNEVLTLLKNMLLKPLDEMEPEYRLQDGILSINRVKHSAEMNKLIGSKLVSHRQETLELGHDRPMLATIERPGLLNSIVFKEPEAFDQECGPDEIIVEVRAVGLTVRDFLVASGKLNDTRIFSQCSGLVTIAGSESGFTCGERVLLSASGCFQTLFKCKAIYALRIPSSIPFPEAASLPIPILAAYHALMNLAGLKKDERVLIHHAAGAVGQMAIQVAQYVGAKVLVTAGSEEEEALLREIYDLPRSAIFRSTDRHLAKSILRATSDSGVDVALNFENSDELDVSNQVLAPFGRLVNLGLGNKLSGFTMTEDLASRCITYISMDVIEMQHRQPALIQKIFQQAAPLIESGCIKPASPILIYEAQEITRALQTFQSGRDSGAVVVDLSPGQEITVSLSSAASRTQLILSVGVYIQ